MIGGEKRHPHIYFVSVYISTSGVRFFVTWFYPAAAVALAKPTSSWAAGLKRLLLEPEGWTLREFGFKLKSFSYCRTSWGVEPRYPCCARTYSDQEFPDFLPSCYNSLYIVWPVPEHGDDSVVVCSACNSAKDVQNQHAISCTVLILARFHVNPASGWSR